MSVDGPITEIDEQENRADSTKLVFVDLVAELLPQAVILEEDPVTKLMEEKRAQDIAQGKRDFGLKKIEGVEEHVFTDGHGQIIPMESRPTKRDVNSWAGRTLRRGPIHYHDDDDNHVSRDRRPVIDPDSDQIEAYENEDGLEGNGHDPMMQKLPRPHRLKTLDVARKRAASYQSRRHD
jgi:hypothetical protein